MSLTAVFLFLLPAVSSVLNHRVSLLSIHLAEAFLQGQGLKSSEGKATPLPENIQQPQQDATGACLCNVMAFYVSCKRVGVQDRTLLA